MHDECLKAFGTYSFRFLLPSMVINCSLQILRLMTIIYFESRALINPDNFWWRPAVTISNYLLQTSLILSHMFTVFVTGDDGASWMHIGLGILLSGTFALGAMYLEPRISPIYAAYCGAVGLFLSQPFLHYYETIKIYPSRRLLPSLMWAMCCPLVAENNRHSCARSVAILAHSTGPLFFSEVSLNFAASKGMSAKIMESDP